MFPLKYFDNALSISDFPVPELGCMSANTKTEYRTEFQSLSKRFASKWIQTRHARFSGDGTYRNCKKSYHEALQYLLVDMVYSLTYRTMAITALYTDLPGELHLSKESQIPVAHHWQRSLDLGLDKTNSGLVVESTRALEQFRTNIGDLLFPPNDAVWISDCRGSSYLADNEQAS